VVQAPILEVLVACGYDQLFDGHEEWENMVHRYRVLAMHQASLESTFNVLWRQVSDHRVALTMKNKEMMMYLWVNGPKGPGGRAAGLDYTVFVNLTVDVFLNQELCKIDTYTVLDESKAQLPADLRPTSISIINLAKTFTSTHSTARWLMPNK